jgi:uncharacterized protein (DUF4415 family)
MLDLISVDPKKKELVGHFKNGGKGWQQQWDSEQVKHMTLWLKS